MHTARRLRFGATLGLVASTMMVTSGCMRSVDLPRNELESTQQWHGEYKVTTVRDLYVAREFSTNDSTLVITRLSGADRAHGGTALPIVIRWTEVQSVSRQEVNAGKTALIVVGSVAVFVGGLIAIIVNEDD